MSENKRPVVLPVSTCAGVEVMDGGDTLALRFQAPDGRQIALLVPQHTAANLREQVTVGLEAAQKRRSKPRGAS